MMPAFVVIDPLMEQRGQRRDVRARVPMLGELASSLPRCRDVRARVSDSILTIAVVAATYVGHHHQRAVQIMHGCGSLAGRISVARVNRRLHQRANGMVGIPEVLGEVVTTGDGFIIDSLPAPVCRRARMLRVVRHQTGEVLWMACAAGLPTGWHARARSDAARGGASSLPAGARRLGDTASKSAADAASILAETGVRLIPVRRATMRPHAWLMDAIALRAYRHTIETVNRHLEKMGGERLSARTKTTPSSACSSR